eukprot:12700106-Alexandrium_andersonii.AAC.1
MTTKCRRSDDVTAVEGFRALSQPYARWTTASITSTGRLIMYSRQRSSKLNSRMRRRASR